MADGTPPSGSPSRSASPGADDESESLLIVPSHPRRAWAQKAKGRVISTVSNRVFLSVACFVIGLVAAVAYVTVQRASGASPTHSWIQNLAGSGDPHVAVHVAAHVARAMHLKIHAAEAGGGNNETAAARGTAVARGGDLVVRERASTDPPATVPWRRARSINAGRAALGGGARRAGIDGKRAATDT